MANSSQRITADRPCAISGGTDCEIVASRAREGHALRNVISVDSGLIYVDPLPVEDLAQYYREDYRVAYKGSFVPQLKHVLRAGNVAVDRLGHAKGQIKAGQRCLDIGAGGGEWAYLMKTLGCDSFGVEPNQGYGSYARDSYDVEVFLGMYQESVFDRESFDVVTLFQVLEHLADPVEDIRRMSEYLKPGGLFVIEVPDILFGGMHFKHKWHDGHLYGFDALTLEATAARAGLKKVFLDVLPGNLYGVFQKVEDETVEIPDLVGHCEAAKAQLFGGESSYWFQPNTYLKVPRRLVQRSKEYVISNKIDSPRAILDHVYSSLSS